MSNTNTPKLISIKNAPSFTETELSHLVEKIQNLRNDVENAAITAATAGDSDGSGSCTQRGSGERKKEVDKLENGLDQIAARLSQLGKFEESFQGMVNHRVKAVEKLLEDIRKADGMEADGLDDRAGDDDAVSTTEDEVVKQLHLMNKEIRKLKHQIPSLPAEAKASGGAGRQTGSPAQEVEAEVGALLAPRGIEGFRQSDLFREVSEAYESLSDKKKKCVLCFAVFAENEEVKKRMVAYWWAAEGLLDKDDDEEENKKMQGRRLTKSLTSGSVPERKDIDIREATGDILKEFVRLQLIQPVQRKRWQESKRFKMEPIVRSAIAIINEENNFAKFTEDMRFAAMFSDGNKSTSEHVPWWKEVEKLGTVFNVNEQFPDLRVKKLAKLNDLEAREWLLKMKALKVLYLGTWRSSGKHHIEVEGIEFLKGLKNMKNLKLLSLQGISRINELTGSIKWLTKLEILDLKSCHNLELLPKEISFLKNLTHLDVSNCFLIDHMPRGLSSLTKLQVLKGFVVGDYRTKKFCTLERLSDLKSLKKLSVVISKKDFPTESELRALSALTALERLTLSWGAESSAGLINGNGFTGKDDLQGTLPPNLKKLDLQCYPHSSTPSWLFPEKLANLKRLYIRGGRLGEDGNSGLLLTGNGQWKEVDTLRLKYLAGMRMAWEDVKRRFPKLNYLEKVDCPLITLCPCDEDGVWVKESSA